jgi:flagellar FliL protein
MSDEGQNIKLMIVVMLVLSLAIAAGTSYFMLTKLTGNSSKAEAEGKINELGPTYKVGEFIVNLADGSSQFIRLNLSVEVNNEDIVEELKRRDPQIRDTIISILRDKQEEDISSKSGTRDLREEIRTELNKFISEGKITNVFFTEFVVQ